MLRVKRTKGSAVHYAAELGKEGNVTRWVADKGAALALTQKDADRVKAFHAGLSEDQRKKAGELAFEPVSEAELKAQLDAKQEQETSLLQRLIDQAIAPLRERLQALEAQAQDKNKMNVPAAAPPAGPGPKPGK